MTDPAICIELQDGTGTYVTRVPVTNFEPESVALAVGEAAAWFIDGYRRDYDERGSVWDPSAAGIGRTFVSPHECRVCLRPVLSPDAWIEVDRVGRIWVCPRHMNDTTRIEITDDRTLIWTDDGPTLLWSAELAEKG